MHGELIKSTKEFLNILNEKKKQMEDDKEIYAEVDELNHLHITSFQPFGRKYMFPCPENITGLDASKLTLPNVTDYSLLFSNYEKIESLILSKLDTHEAILMRFMFYDCKNLKELDLSTFNTSKVKDMYAMFCSCKSLESLNIKSFDFSNVENIESMFLGCEKLRNLSFGKNLKESINLTESPLNHGSVMSVIKGLAKVEKQQTLWISEESYNTLSKDEIKLAKKKNWLINTIAINQ